MCLRYREMDEPVLKDITCSIRDKEKVHLIYSKFIFQVTTTTVMFILWNFLNIFRLELLEEPEQENRRSLHRYSVWRSRRAPSTLMVSIPRLLAWTCFGLTSPSSHRILFCSQGPYARTWTTLGSTVMNNCGMFWNRYLFIMFYRLFIRDLICLYFCRLNWRRLFQIYLQDLILSWLKVEPIFL